MKQRTSVLRKLATGIEGLDEVFYGGIPQGRALLVSGVAGTGKTVFLNCFLYQGIQKFRQNGVFVTFEEHPRDIMQNVRSFGWDYESLVKSGKLTFVDASTDLSALEEVETGAYDLSPFLARIKYAVKKSQATRVAIDSLGSLFGKFADRHAVRRLLFELCDYLKIINVTSMIASENSPEGASFLGGIDEFVVDGAIELKATQGQQKIIREILIRKLRGSPYRSGKVEYEITSKGLEVFPKIEVNRNVSKTDFETRMAFGVPSLDAVVGGGIPQGQVCLISGNTGTGMSILAIQFLLDGLIKKEPGVFVGMEEHVDEIRKAARGRGINLLKYEKAGLLQFVSPDSLIDISNDKLLSRIVAAITAIKARRVAFDSISSLVSATMSEEQVRQFLIQLVGFIKTRGITCVATYLVMSSFGAESGQLFAADLDTNTMRLSSLVDAIVVLRYVERDQSVKKILNVLKMRGSRHGNQIYEYVIEKEGIQILKPFQA